MLTYSQLIAPERSLRDERVLSVYLHGAADDPAARGAWRTDLDRSLRDLRRWLAGSPHEEREAFQRCATSLDELLAPFAGGLPTPGWAGFITDDAVQDAERLPVPMPTMAVWSTGMCVAPYIRALKVTRPVIVALIDAKEARVYRYRVGELQLLDTFHAHATIVEPVHMGDAPRAGFHPGVRGETAHDAVQRARAAGTERMLHHAASAVVRHAAVDAGVVIGGSARMATRLAEVAQSLGGRVIRLESLHADASQAEIMAAAKAGASALRDRVDLQRLADILESEAERGMAALGPEATRRALERRAVRDLFITSRFLEDHLADAEDAVRAALDQGATVEQVSSDAAAKLDEHGGLAARLRFHVPDDGTARRELAANDAIEAERV